MDATATELSKSSDQERGICFVGALYLFDPLLRAVARFVQQYEFGIGQENLQEIMDLVTAGE
jgi:hypothetical protein